MREVLGMGILTLTITGSRAATPPRDTLDTQNLWQTRQDISQQQTSLGCRHHHSVEWACFGD